MPITRRHLVHTGLAGTTALAVPALLRAQSSQPLRIGVMMALSGAWASVGEALLRGVQGATAQANRGGGLLGRQVELVVRDDKFNGAGAIAAARELAGAGVNLMIGGSASVTALAVMPLLEELKSVLVVSGAAAMGITHEHYVRHMFRTVANTNVQYGGLGRAMAEQFPGATRWVAIAPDNSFGRDTAKVFAANLRQHHPKSSDLDIRAPMLVSASQSEFRQQINALMSSNVEGVFMAVTGSPTISFMQQARATGLDRRLKVICEGSGDLVAKALGKDMPASFWGPIFWPYQVEPYKSSKVSQAFLKDLVEATHDTHPTTLASLGYRAAQALYEGVRKARSAETEGVIAAMEGLTFESPSGPYRIRRQDHQAIGTVFFAQYAASDQPPGFVVRTVKAVSEESVIESPSPRAEYVI